MTKLTTKQYERKLNKTAKEFRLTALDLSNLYDLMDMADCPDEIHISMRRTIKLNKMDKWFYEFKDKLEDAVIWIEADHVKPAKRKEMEEKKKNG